MEEWKTLIEDSRYEISSYGNVRNKKTQLPITPWLKSGTKYMYVSLADNKKYRLGRLVANNFIPNPMNYPEVNHKDEDKTNNCVDNLEWCPKGYNINYGTRNKRVSEKMIGNTNAPMIKIQKLDMDGNVLAEYRSMRRASEENNIPRGNLTHYFQKGWAQCGGFKWRKVAQ